MIEENQYSACLRISSKTLNVEDITIHLEMKPTMAHEKGTLFSSRNPRSRFRQESLWLLESGLNRSEPLEAQIERLVELIEQKALELEQLMQVCKLDIFCGVFSGSGQGGFVLNSALLKKLAVLSIEVVFDLYLSSPLEEDEDVCRDEVDEREAIISAGVDC